MNEYLTIHKDVKVDHICPNVVVSGGVTIVAGSDGVGKTWTALQIGLSIANGVPFLDWETLQRPVLLIQFELGHAQLKDRLKILSKNYDMNEHFKLVDLNDDDLIFSDAWEKIDRTIIDTAIKKGVVIIDNLYASTDRDVSANHDLKPMLKKIREICLKTDNAFILMAHHNKNEGKDEPLLEKRLITGGKTLTNFANNVFQIGSSSFGNDVFRGKITKVRDKECDLLGLPFILNFDSEKCVFERGGVIPNESTHCHQITDRWEYKFLIDVATYQKDDVFDRARIWQHLSTRDGWEQTPSNQNKVTRFLKRVVAWGFVNTKQNEYNTYHLNRDEIARLEKA